MLGERGAVLAQPCQQEGANADGWDTVLNPVKVTTNCS